MKGRTTGQRLKAIVLCPGTGGEDEEGGAEEHYLLHCLFVFVVSVQFVAVFVRFRHGVGRGPDERRQIDHGLCMNRRGSIFI